MNERLFHREIEIKNNTIDMIKFRCNAIIKDEIKKNIKYHCITGISNNSIEMIIHIIKKELKEGI